MTSTTTDQPTTDAPDIDALRAALAEAEARQEADAARRQARIEDARTQKDRDLLHSQERIEADLNSRETAAQRAAQQAAQSGDFAALYASWLEYAVVTDVKRTLHGRFNSAASRLGQPQPNRAAPKANGGTFSEWMERYTGPAVSALGADLHDSIVGDEIDTLEQADTYLA